MAAAIDERAREIDRGGKETEEAGGKSIEGREIDGQVEKSTARSSIWPFGERENERRKGNERTWSSRRQRLLRASAVRASVVHGASATPLRRPQRERDPARRPSGCAGRRPAGSSLFVASPQAPPSSLLVPLHLRRPAGSSLVVPLHLLSCSCIHVAVLLNSAAFSLIYFAVDFADWSFFV